MRACAELSVSESVELARTANEFCVVESCLARAIGPAATFEVGEIVALATDDVDEKIFADLAGEERTDRSCFAPMSI